MLGAGPRNVLAGATLAVHSSRQKYPAACTRRAGPPRDLATTLHHVQSHNSYATRAGVAKPSPNTIPDPSVSTYANLELGCRPGYRSVLVVQLEYSRKVRYPFRFQQSYINHSVRTSMSDFDSREHVQFSRYGLVNSFAEREFLYLGQSTSFF